MQQKFLLFVVFPFEKAIQLNGDVASCNISKARHSKVEHAVAITPPKTNTLNFCTISTS